MEKVEIEREDLELFVKMLRGLDVPVSLGMPLGVAGEVYNDIRNKHDLFGWLTEDEILDKMGIPQK